MLLLRVHHLTATVQVEAMQARARAQAAEASAKAATEADRQAVAAAPPEEVQSQLHCTMQSIGGLTPHQLDVFVWNTLSTLLAHQTNCL